MSSRTEKRRERKPTSKAPKKSWRAIDVSSWFLRCSVLLLIIALPWNYGSVEWGSQYGLAWAGAFICVAIAVHCMISVSSKSGDLSIPWLTWLFFLFGFVAFVQSLSMYSWQGSGIAPASVQVQRWALGLTSAPKSLQSNLLVTSNEASPDESKARMDVPCDLKSVPESDRRLAWSIEPLHTRGAVASLLLCGLFVWVGRLAFSDAKKQLWLFGTLTGIGIVIACVGIQGAVSYRSENFLGLRSGSSFATFVSKNSAGGFYNICIAGCLGLLGWTLLHTQRASKDNRYRFPDTTLFSKIRGFAEDSLADLNTAQIAMVLCLISIVAALLISLCRGAAVSALGAIIVACLIANAKSRSSGNWVVSVAVATVLVACMVGFQIDDRAYARLESLSEIDLEDELREGRVYIWSIAWKAMSFYGLLGSGLGTFHFAYLPFQEPSSQGWYYHAESLYAQCGVELGYIGVSVLVLAIVALLAGLQRPVAKENWGVAFPSKLAGTYLVVSQALHSFVDFAIIIPALFVPACALIGSAQGALQKAEIAPVRKRARSDTTTPTLAVLAIETPWLRNGLVSGLIAIGIGLAVLSSTASLHSLAMAESMEAWIKLEEKQTLELQAPSSVREDRVHETAKIWSMGNATWKENPMAMRAFADSHIFDFRMNQMIKTPPKGDWLEPWMYTSPAALQRVMNQDKDGSMKEQIIEEVGGQKAIRLLESASNLYALGQSKSPLDWRLLWGRCLSNTSCPRNEIVKLLPASMTIAKHNAQQLLASAVLFRDQFDQSQFERVLSQAMKSNPGYETARDSAKIIALESADKDIPIKIFPQRYDVLESIATDKDTFTKDAFPKTNDRLWERAQELIMTARIPPASREVWLAKSWAARNDINEELFHLNAAIRFEPINIKLHFNLAKRLIDTGDINRAGYVLTDMKKLNPKSSESIVISDLIAKKLKEDK